MRGAAGKASVALVTQLVTDRAQVGMGTGKVLLVSNEERPALLCRGPQLCCTAPHSCVESRITSDELGYVSKDVSKQSVESVVWFLLAAYHKCERRAVPYSGRQTGHSSGTLSACLSRARGCEKRKRILLKRAKGGAAQPSAVDVRSNTRPQIHSSISAGAGSRDLQRAFCLLAGTPVTHTGSPQGF